MSAWALRAGSAVPALGAAVLLALMDGPEGLPMAFPALLAAAAALWVLEIGLAEGTRRLPPKGAAVLVALALGAGPVVFVLPRLMAAPRGHLWMAAPVIGVGALVGWFSGRVAHKSGPVALGAALELLGGFLLTHSLTGTLSAPRPGTAGLHLALYLGLWGGSAALLAPWSVRLARRAGLRPRVARPLRLAWSLAAIIAAQVDGRALVDLYPAVHLWLAGVALATLDASLTSLADVPTLERLNRLAPLALFAGLPLFGMVLTTPQSPGERATLASTTVGGHVLSLFAEVMPLEAPEAVPLFPIDHPRFFDLKRPGPRPNLVLVTVDALRADVVGSPVAPNLTAFAQESRWFPRAYAQGSRTAIGMSCLMLGRYSAHIQWDLWVYADDLYRPEDFGAQARARAQGRYDHTTVPRFVPGERLAERLSAVGYQTVGVPYLRGVNFFRPGVGFEVGFEIYETFAGDDGSLPSSPRITRRALAALHGLDPARPWFLWVHYYDPHESRGNLKYYSTLVQAFDASFGALLRGLDAQGGARPTVVALTADHGEAFGEHRHRHHGTSLYEEQVRIPLGLRVPGEGPSVYPSPVAGIDLTATLLVLAGARTEGLDGLNLIGLDPAAPIKRPIFSELHRYISQDGHRTADLKAVISHGMKLIINRLTGGAELYDLGRDPGETLNLMARAGAEVPANYVQLQGMLRSLLEDPKRSRALP